MKKLFRIIGFVLGLIVIIVFLDIPFRGGYWYARGYVADRDARIAGIQEEPERQIDVLNVGDSLADIAITPVELYRDYGITSYVMGRDLQKTIESYYAIKLALRSQDIKVVLYEMHNLCKGQQDLDPYIIAISEYAKYRSQFIKYHYVWKRWIEGKGIRKYFKGYVVNETVTPCDREIPFLNLDVEESYEIPEDQRRDFEKIYRLCKQEGIQLVLYCVPSPHCYNMSMHNGYAKFAEEYGLPFLDGNMDIEKIGIDMSRDYFDKDGDHLNLFGTRKMTNYLAEYLVSECDLVDHRGDPAYQSWADQLAAYEQEVKDMEGTGYPILEEKLKKGRPAPPDRSGK